MRFPDDLASSSTVCFTGSMRTATCRTDRWSSALTAAVRVEPCSTSPVFDTSTEYCGGALEPDARCASDAMVPGATNALYDTTSRPLQKPATPVCGITRSTRNGTERPYAK